MDVVQSKTFAITINPSLTNLYGPPPKFISHYKQKFIIYPFEFVRLAVIENGVKLFKTISIVAVKGVAHPVFISEQELTGHYIGSL